MSDDSNSVNVMVCDDSRFIRRMTEKLLTKMGHKVLVEATDGEEAINIFLDYWYDIDIVLLDVVMPKLDGIRALKEMLKINPYAKVVMVTSISSMSIVQGCMKAGAADFVVKPFRISEFVKAINNVIQREEKNAYESNTSE